MLLPASAFAEAASYNVVGSLHGASRPDGIMGPMTVMLKGSDLARIQSASGVDYRLTPTDALWVQRAAVFESAREDSNPAAVLWTLAQRFVLQKQRGNTKYSTFAAMLRDFSQPLNPKWRAGGLYCKAGGAYHGTPSCSADKLARRQLAQTATVAELAERAPATLAIANQWLMGRVANPVPRATDFAQEPVANNFLARNPDAEVLLKEPAAGCPACNVIIVTAATVNWPVDHVWMLGADGSRALASNYVPGRAGVRFASSFWGGVASWWRG